MRLVLRRGTVTEADEPAAPPAEQRLIVDVPGRGPRAAICDPLLHGTARTGDDVVVNTQAADLALGSGGFDVLHANLTRGLDGAGEPGAHVVKLNYTSLQHAVAPVEGPRLELPLGAPVAVLALHGQLAPLAWAAQAAAPGLRLGYVQTAGGALPGGHSRVVRRLREEGLLAGHLTAAPAYGGEGEAITTAGALHHGVRALGWDAAVVGPGPGILGSGSALGHGGLLALDACHAALALGAPTWLCARMSRADPRARHRGLSHHTRTVLELLLAPVRVAVPLGCRHEVPAGHAGHDAVEHDVEGALRGYRASGLPASNMGRTLDADPAFFAAALACGTDVASTPRPTPETP